MKKTYINAVCLILLMSLNTAYAQVPVNQPTRSAYPASSQQIPDPRDTIRTSIQRIKAFLATDAHANADKINAFIEKEVAPTFDFVAMTRMIMGPLNYQMNDQQRRGVTTLIKRAFLSALANNLSQYRGGQVGNIRISGNPERGRVRAGLAIYMPNQYPTAIELRIALGPKGWKIIDVSANGISAVAHYRNYVRSVVQRSGLEGLLQ
jgi:phospholipid transport system substrate-binding protein